MVEAAKHRRVRQGLGVAYTILPGPRNQDVVRIVPGKGDLKFIACVVDGWNNREFLPENETGRKVAEFVAERFPQIFQETKIRDLKKRAQAACQTMDSEVLSRWPAHASCLGTFLFSFDKKDVIVTVGSVVVFLWDGRRWYRPKSIGNYSLDDSKYASDVSRFFGRGELKNNSFYSCEPDVTICPPEKPIFIASDGLEDLFTLEQFNAFTQSLLSQPAKVFARTLQEEIQRKKDQQKDDIAFLIKNWPPKK